MKKMVVKSIQVKEYEKFQQFQHFKKENINLHI